MMFDLTLDAAQQAAVQAARDAAPGLRDVGAACEAARKPATELLGAIAAGSYPLPLIDGDADPLGAVAAAAEYGYADPGVALTIVGSWQAQLLGSPTHDPAGQLVSLMLYEGFGRTPAEFRTTARRVGYGWVLNGHKESVLHPNSAPVTLVAARLAEGAEVAIFRLEGGPRGLIVERDDATDGKLGLRAAHTGAVRLENVIVANDARIAVDSRELAKSLALSRILVGAIALGVARASLEYAIEWAKVRSAFGKTIGTYQGVAFVLADVQTAIESVQLLLWETSTRLQEHVDAGTEDVAVSHAVGRACAVANDAARQGINLLGVHGIVTDHPVERWFRSAAALSTIDFDPKAVALEAV